MKKIGMLFLVPPILYATHATAQNSINIPSTNSTSEIRETGVPPQEPTAEELANPVVVAYGRSHGREIPEVMALLSFARFTLRQMNDPTNPLRGWELGEEKDAVLKTILNQFLAGYERAHNNLKAESCNIYSTLKGQSLDIAERNAYTLLLEIPAEAELLVAPTLAAIRTEVSDFMADVFDREIKKIIETSSMSVLDYGALNARHGVPAEEFFGNTCP